MTQWNIRQRLLFLALAPLFITIVSMSIFYTTVRIKQFEQELDRKGSTIARQFAPSCEYGVISGNREILEQLASALLQEQDIVHVSIKNRDGDILFSSENLLRQESSGKSRQAIEYSAPIVRSLVPISDENSGQLGADEPEATVGMVSIGLLRDETITLQRRALLESIFITITALGITTLIALRMAKRLSDPLRNISTAVAHIRNGNFNHRIEAGSGGELGQLEDGINSLATALIDAFKRDKVKNERLEAINKFLKEEINVRQQVQEELLSAKENAEEANQAKTEFLANMGHELRTPLNSVMGFTELLLLSNLDDEQRKYAEHCLNSSQELLNIIRDILDFSRLDAGTLSIVSVPFNLRQALQESVDIVSIRASRKHLELVVDYPLGQPERVMGDPGRIRQIITNLLSNAINFTDSGEIVIKVLTAITSGNLATIKIDISDSGKGIPPDKLPIIFERFTQADSSLTRQQQGLGLGLAICKQLVTLMGGTIHARSIEGVGSTFTLTLMLPQDPAKSKPDEYHFDGLTAAVIEQNDTSARVLQQMLEYHGLRVNLFKTCTELLEATRQSPGTTRFDLVFINSESPGDDRDAACAALRKVDSLARVPFIAMCTAECQRYLHRHLGILYNALLTKPVNTNELPLTIDRVLSLSPTSLAASDYTAEPTITAAGEGQSWQNRPDRKPILVVDDNDINRKLAVSTLHKLGYPAETAESGIDALDMLKQQPGHYAVIFMDILMPDMDGYTTTREIRRFEQEQGLPENIIIALTAKAMEGDRELCLTAGMNDYMSKPLQITTLKTVLAKWINNPDKTSPPRDGAEPD